MKKAVVAAAVFLLVLFGAGCSEWNDERGLGDAPVQNRTGDDKAAVVINFPDGFANVALKCYNGNGICSTTRPAPPVIIQSDPLCDGDEVVELQTPR